MQADDHAVEEVLAEGRRFMVPLYQRKYQWHDPQLVPFWEDVEAKAIEVLEDASKFQHYMGALILSPIGEAAQIGVTPRVQVVDGQQRLTTFQLFLAAIREVARTHGCKNVEEHVGDYLFNKLKSKDTDKLTQFKLTPTPSDQSVFFDIVKEKYSTIRSRYQKYYWSDRVPMNTPIRALRAYEEFYRLIDRFARFGSAELNSDGDEGRETETISDETDTTQAIETRLEAMLTALLNRMKLVVIVLGEDDDAQVIFETLNSKGEPLLAMDLVRNNIFYRASESKRRSKNFTKSSGIHSMTPGGENQLLSLDPGDRESIIFLLMCWQRKLARKFQCASSTLNIGPSRFPRGSRDSKASRMNFEFLGNIHLATKLSKGTSRRTWTCTGWDESWPRGRLLRPIQSPCMSVRVE